MPRAIANPEEIRQFAHVLLQNVNHIRTLRADLMSRFNALRDHWNDEKYNRFREIFTTMMNQIEPFLQQSETYVRYLHRKAEKLEEYLRHQY
jgi:uncharacterized protein YukE